MRAKTVKIELQSLSNSQSATGQPDGTWSTYATVYASIRQLRADEYYAAESTVGRIAMEAYIWYTAGISSDDRAIVYVDDSTTYTCEVAGPPGILGLDKREMVLRLRYVE